MKTTLAVLALGTGCLYANGIYDVTNLGSLGGSMSAAYAISPNGAVAGTATDVFGNMRAVSFGLNGPSVLAASGDAMASGVNDAGQIVGTSYIDGTAHATVWQGGQLVQTGAAGSYALAVNAAGDMAGMLTSGAQGHAFISKSLTTEDLGMLPGGNWSSAYALNSQGQAAGYADAGSGKFRAFLWSPDTGYTVLGTLGGTNSYAMGINDSGVATGHAQTAGGYLHAFRSSGGALEDLGTLGGASSYAYGINSGGDAVGYSLLASGADHAFLSQGGALLDLNSLIDPASGWVLTQAYAINDGRQIVGSGMYHGAASAFRLDLAPIVSREGSMGLSTQAESSTVPEASTWILVAIGVGLILLSRAGRARAKR